MESRYPPHPAAQAFPLMTGEAYERHREDVRDNGIRIPIMLAKHEAQWMILDGRNRQRACDETGRKPRYEYFEGDLAAAVRYAVSVNMARRHLNETQRSLAAKRLASLGWGGDRSKAPIGALTQADAAELMNVSERSVDRAGVVLEHGIPELIEEADKGEIAVSRAAEIAKLSDEQQRDELAQLKSHDKPKREPAAQRDRWMTREIRLTESDVRGLQALIDMADDHGEPLAREGVRVLRKMAPWVGS